MRPIDGDSLKRHVKAECNPYGKPTIGFEDGCKVLDMIDNEPTIKSLQLEAEWIECDYKYIAHGFVECEPNAGLCCSNCRTAFRKKHMLYKQYCAACGAKMKNVKGFRFIKEVKE